MKKLTLIFFALFLLVFSMQIVSAQSFFNLFGGGGGTISTLDQFTSTTSPIAAITQRTFGKALRLSGQSDGCAEFSNSGILASTGSACGSGSGSSSSFSTTSADFWLPKNPLTAGSFVATSTATSTFSGGLYGSLISAPYFHATSSTATSTFAGGLSVAGTSGLTVLQNGNVGVGTAAPNNKLQVAGLVNFDDTAFNISLGTGAGQNLDGTGIHNIFIGYQAGLTATTSDYNTAVGYQALTNLNNAAAGGRNSAFGYKSLYSNTTGRNNTANGYYSLYSNTTGSFNTANGLYSLEANTTGSNNTASGYLSLFSNDTGSYNTAHGNASLSGNSTGSYNTAQGYASLGSNSSGSYNIAIGYQAGEDLQTGNNNILIGYGVDATSTDSVNFLNIGNTIYGNTGTGNVGLGTTSPYAKLSVVGEVVGAYFTATTTATSTLPRLSSTGIATDWLCIAGTCNASWPTSASSTLLSDANTFSGTNIFSGNFSLTGLSAGGVAVNSSGLLYSFATSTWTFASSTLLADSNTFSGNNTFSNTITGSITGNAGTATVLQTARNINGTSFDGSADITITAASSTLLANSNTWTGTNAFAGLTATSFNLGSGLANMLAGFDASGNLTSTSSPQVAYINATSTTATSTFAGGLTVDGTTLVVDYSSNNVGIGTAGPIAKLNSYSTSAVQAVFNGWSTLTGGSAITAGEIQIGGSVATQGRIGYTANGSTIFALDNTYTGNSNSAIQFRFGTSPVLTALQSGNVGIGTTSPYAKLSISGFTTGTPGIVADALSGFTGNLLDLKVASSTKFSIDQTGAITSVGFINSDMYSGYKQNGATILFATTSSNIFVGESAGGLITNGALDGNSAIGYQAMYNASSTAADKSVAVGYEALRNSNGARNTALGYQALKNVYTGADNVAIGYQALVNNITGSTNVAIGANALGNLTATTDIVAIGNGALGALTTGASNVGLGYSAGLKITTNSSLTAIGASALRFTTGGFNTGVGALAGQGVDGTSTYTEATLIGYNAGLRLTTGIRNTALGVHSGNDITTGATNVCLGAYSCDGLTTGTSNIGLGFNVQFIDGTASGQMNIGSAIFGQNYTGDSATEDTNAETGIGENSPLARLHVKGGTASTPIFIIEGATSQSGDYLQINATSSSAIGGDIFSIESNGRTGVGTTTPYAKLSVSGGSASTDNVFAVSTSTASATSTVFQISSQGQVQIKNAVPYYGTGASTAIACYMSDGSLGHITITSLLASGSCVQN